MWSNFTAHFAYTEEEDGVLTVGLADAEHQTDKYVLFQRTQHPDAQDRALHHDQVHWTVGDQRYSGYGGIEQVVLSNQKLMVVFEAEAARKVGVLKQIDIALALSSTDLARLDAALRRLMPEFLNPS